MHPSRLFWNILLTIAVAVCAVFLTRLFFVSPAPLEQREIPTLTETSPEKLATLDFAYLAQHDPIAALEAGLSSYRHSVKGYTCVMRKQEFLRGKIQPAEKVTCKFRKEPFSVFMEWVEGKGQADASLYVRGENGGKILIRPASAFKYGLLKATGTWYAALALTDSDVRSASRYSVDDFGLEAGMERTYTAWKKASDDGRFHVRYLGIESPELLGNRRCHVLQRECIPPEEDGLTLITIYLDAETWLQTGSTLMVNDRLLGSYHFTQIVINPKTSDEAFLPISLKK